LLLMLNVFPLLLTFIDAIKPRDLAKNRTKSLIGFYSRLSQIISLTRYVDLQATQ
jgi:hypothetical protein